jgi:multiple sugar transport system substrate-binding protein
MSHKSTLVRLTFVLMLLIAMAAAIGPAAAQDEEPSGKLSVGIWGGKQDIDEVRAVIEAYEAAFPNVILDVQEGNCGTDYASCKTLIAGGSMFDVFVPGN